MAFSVFDLFRIGIGPSSSHTVGPMRAARGFLLDLEARGLLEGILSVQAELFGSLAATGPGHGTDRAIFLGLEGETPEGVDVDGISARLEAARSSGTLRLLGKREIPFSLHSDLSLVRKSLPFHPNGLRFTALDGSGQLLARETFYSIGGGFVVKEGERAADPEQVPVPHPFSSATELLEHCRQSSLDISGLMLANEQTWRSKDGVEKGLLDIWAAMEACVRRGCQAEGVLPGGLGLPRRAPSLLRRLSSHPEAGLKDPLTAMDFVNLYALAVNEENAAGGRVVTAPTNGAAGIIPAVLHYYTRLVPGANTGGVVRFLLTAGAIGSLYKENASISGAEVGCQGEVGVACSMAAGALTEVLGGSPGQVENAAEIGMEHNLGLTCDPIRGLVQVPCIERNAMAAVKAINAARMALVGDGHHYVSLDRVIRTMRETGRDMASKYKETARGGLAVHGVSVGLAEC
nr:L-serine ammonia-lyase [uncultured Holophaga sp.]